MSYKILEKNYQPMMGKRCDDPGYNKYFTYLDFAGLKEIPYEFKSKKGETLRGGLYFTKESIDEYDDLVIFCHGMGGGYLAYMSEINELCQRGFLVLAFDYEATFSSSGDALVAFTRPLTDLEDCGKAIKADPRLSNKKIKVMGHSWGGLAAINSFKIIDGVTHIVAVAAPLSIRMLVKQTVGILYPFIVKKTLSYEEMLLGPLCYLDGMDIAESDVNLLCIYSTDDDIIIPKNNALRLKKVDQKPNHHYLEFNDRNHFPLHSDEARRALLDYKHMVEKAFKDGLKNEEIKELTKDVDWNLLVKQDKVVWDKIEKFLR